MKYLHERLHTLREGIAGSSPRTIRWILNEISQILPIARIDDSHIVPELLRLQKGLETTEDNDWGKRVELDQIASNILNYQERRYREIL